MAQVNAGRVRFISRGEYNNSIQYYLFDLVDYNGSSYFAKANTTGNVPTNTTYWQLVAEKGNTGGDGPVGPTGNGIASIVKTASAGLIDTYTITFTDGTTTTFNVTNGQDGDVTQEYVDEENERLKSVFNVLPKVSDSGESVTLENTGDTMLYKMDLKGNTSQEVVQGEVGLEEEDTSIYVDDVNEDKENYITLKGNTYQDSTSGNQLLALKSGTYTSLGITKTVTNSSVTFSGVPERDWTNTDNISFDKPLTANTTYNISYTGNADIYLWFKNSLGTTVTSINLDTTTRSKTFTSNEEVTQYVIGINHMTVGTRVDAVVYPMLVSGSTVKDFEPYTNGASPNPDYPQDIEVVTGLNEVIVEGKNLFDNSKAQIGKAWNNASNSARAIVITKVEPNTTYYISYLNNGAIDDIYWFDRINENDNTTVSGTMQITQPISITTKSNVHYIGIQLNKTSITQEDINKVGIQIEKGSTATTYEAYKGQTYEVNLGRYVPAGYTQVDYIESTGTQYIDTGISSNINIETEIDVQFTQASTASQLLMWISSSSGQWAGQINGKYGLGGGIGFDINSTTRKLVKISFSANNSTQTVNMEIDGNVISRNGAVPSATNYKIFKTDTFGSYARIYSVIIKENDVILRKYIPCYRNSDNEVGMYDLVTNTFFTNAGTGAFTYGNVVPNTSIELCKIGTYQDRIYKSLVDGNWYVHKEIGKVVLDGSGDEDLSIIATANGNEFRYFDYSIKVNSSSSNIMPVFSNHFIQSSPNQLWNNLINGIAVADTSKRILFKTANTSINTLELFKTWLSNNNVTVYYILDTPTDTQITDTTLVNQLNALYNATIYSTTHINTETSNLLPYINLKYNVVTASPSPDRASEVEVVKGNNSIVIRDENNTKSQTYNITLGNLELCKIGNYQDYFYKDNGNWYLHKEVGKAVLNGSENWIYYASASTSVFYIMPEIFGIYYKQEANLSCYCDYYKGKGQVASFDDVYNLGNNVITFRTTFTRLVIRDDRFNNIEDFKAELSTNNTTLYYVLATPTTTQITDQLLVSQLDELQKAMSYYDKTIITQTNADKPFILDVIAIRDLQDIFNL